MFMAPPLPSVFLQSQLGHLMGYRIIALCSPHNAELVKSLGADEVVDYHDAEKASADIKRISGGGVTLGLDTISEGKSFQICLGGFGDKGGRLNAILPVSQMGKYPVKSWFIGSLWIDMGRYSA